MMAGSRMDIGVDVANGKAVGPHIQPDGRVLGIALHVDEVVTAHEPPLRKVWEATGTPRLLVIGTYRMGYEITPDGAASDLRVFDYTCPRPDSPNGRAACSAGFYARWCTEMMADDAARQFAEESLEDSRSRP